MTERPEPVAPEPSDPPKPASFHLAQFNVARLRQPLDHADSAAFVEALGPINELAESSPGFVWRLTADDGQSSSYVEIPGNEDVLLIINYSIWRGLESLKAFVYKTGHTAYLRRRLEWFERSEQVTTVCWWAPEGTIPDVADANRRLQLLRNVGPSVEGWPINRPEEPPVLG